MKKTEKKINQKYVSKLFIGSVTSLIYLSSLINLHSITTRSRRYLAGTKPQTETNPNNLKRHLLGWWTLIRPLISGCIFRGIWHDAVKITPVTTPATLDIKMPPIRRCDNAELRFIFPQLCRRDLAVNSNEVAQRRRIALFLPPKKATRQERKCSSGTLGHLKV